MSLHILKRNGSHQVVSPEKILARLSTLSFGLDQNFVDLRGLVDHIMKGLTDNLPAEKLDELVAQTAAYSVTRHPDYGLLGGRLAVSALHKTTSASVLDTFRRLRNHVCPKTGKAAPLINDDVIAVVEKHHEALQQMVDYHRDLNYEYFGYKTLERSYLLRVEVELGKLIVVERPQHMLLRVAVGIHLDDIDAVRETYDLLSTGVFTHATPTLFNAGTCKPQMSSCFLVAMKDDSIEGIYDTLKQCAQISKSAGGIGLHTHCIRATGSYIAGTNGTSNGLVPMLRVWNNTARYVDQCFAPSTIVYTDGGAKRIADVVPGDKVIARDGSFQEVAENVVFEVEGSSDDTKPMVQYRIKGGSADAIQVTADHLVWAASATSADDAASSSSSWDTIKQQIATGAVEFKFMPAKELRKGSLVAIPIPTHECDDSELTHADCFAYGLVLGGAGAAAAASAASKFGRDDFFDVHTGEKTVKPSMLHLPLSKALQVVKGFVQAAAADCEAENELSVSCASKSVLEGMRYVLLRAGVLAASTAAHNGLRIPKVAAIRELFCLRERDAIAAADFAVHDGFVVARVDEAPAPVPRQDKPRFVHDLKIALPAGRTEHEQERELPHEDAGMLEEDDRHDAVKAYLTASGGLAHNGGGKRKGAFAVYLEPWHADIFDFLMLKRSTGKDENRARDLFYGLWIPDLFMKRVEAHGQWTLFDPHTAPGLFDCWGAEFEALYEKYEKEGRGVKTVPAHELWFHILESQIETGTPYMLYKDACNGKSNQQNLGTIKCSNLCTEIVEFTSPDEIAVCNLASLALNAFVDVAKQTFDHKRLYEVTKVVTRNLNKVIDRNFYPVEEARRSNMRHRPIGLGVQGLADAFVLLRMPFTSPPAQQLNEEIFETIYFAACESSIELAEKDGPYETFPGSPASQGKFQFDLWNKQPTSGRWDWNALRARMVKSGLRNSLLLAPMPTASTAQILGNTEAFECQTSNIYLRRVLSGEFPVVNKHLVTDLIKRGMWNEDVRNEIIAHNGSIQRVQCIPQDIKELYKVVWEIKMKDVIDMAAARGKYIDQSQSLNLFLEAPKTSQLTSMHFYAWRAGLKTGMYYLRSRPAVDAIKFTVDQKRLAQTTGAAAINSQQGTQQQQQHQQSQMSKAALVGSAGNAGGDVGGCENCGS